MTIIDFMNVVTYSIALFQLGWWFHDVIDHKSKK